MTKDSLQKLEKLNQLCLKEEEKESVIAFFAKQDDEFATLENIDTLRTKAEAALNRKGIKIPETDAYGRDWR